LALKIIISPRIEFSHDPHLDFLTFLVFIFYLITSVHSVLLFAA
jgi:hypothetical protein